MAVLPTESNIQMSDAGVVGKSGSGAGLSSLLSPSQLRTLLSVQTAAEVAAAYQPIGNYATLVGGLVPSSQLPSYVDDVIEGANLAAFPATGETGKIYVALDTSRTYRWSGSAYVELTDSTAVWGSISGTLSNQTDLQSALNAKAPSSHTHTTADITGFGEAVDDEVASLLVAGTNITITYNDVANTLTIASTASGGTPGGSSGQVQFNNAGAFGGAAAVVYAATGTHLVVTAQSATAVPVCVKGAASQTGNLTEWQNSAGTVLAGVNSGGEVFSGRFRSTATGTSSLYLIEGLRKRWDFSNGEQGQYIISGSNFDGGGNMILLGTTATQYDPAGANHRLIIDCGNRILQLGGTLVVSPQPYEMRGQGASGTNVAGGKLTLSPGRSTGNATPAIIALATTTVTTSGTTLQTLRDVLQCDGNTTSGETPMLLLDCAKGTLQRVSIGAADSGGTGFKVLRVPN